MEILEAFDATGSLRAAAELVGCDHKTVGHCDQGPRSGGRRVARSGQGAAAGDAFAEKIEEWVERSQAKIRGDVVHRKLVAMGYQGSERTTRRAVAEATRRWRAGHGRRNRPWTTEPGLWMQWD